MQDLELLRDFDSQPVLAHEPEIVPISIANEMTPEMAAYYQATGVYPQPQVQPQQFTNQTQPKQVFSQPETLTPLMQQAAKASVSQAQPIKEEPVQLTTISPQPTPQPQAQQFSMWKPTGQVPPGLKAAMDCNNCVYFLEQCEFGYCQKHDFPCAENYVCDDFEMRESSVYCDEEVTGAVEEEYSEPESFGLQRLSNETESTDRLQNLFQEYSDVVGLFSDGELAGQCLESTVLRFSSRSVYSDAFLKHTYKKQYEAKYQTLDNAYIEEV